MAEARSEMMWNHTSCILATMANIYRDPKRRGAPFKPEEFHPHYARRKPVLDFDVLRVLVKGRPS